MSELVQVEMAGKTFWMETRVVPPTEEEAGVEGGLREMKAPSPAELGEKIKALINDMAAGIKGAAEAAKPDTVSVAFAVSLTGKFGIPFVAEGGGTGGITVTLQWKTG